VRIIRKIIPAKAWNVPARSRYELVSSRRTRKR
jgi:hypothetical protein